MDQLTQSAIPLRPLAERVRPQTLDEVIGQPELIGPQGLLRRWIRHSTFPSVIFWGPPGCGKTTVAEILMRCLQHPAFSMSAAHTSSVTVKKLIDEARKKPPYILFLDEIHRFNKAQQDALLRAVEKGDLILIGATTENPSFSVIRPLLSRTQVVIFRPLSTDDLPLLYEHALRRDEWLRQRQLHIEAWKTLHMYTGGDARRFLNLIELLAQSYPHKHITDEVVHRFVRSHPMPYDRQGDQHYDQISALIKSIRGSDPDAALYWMVRMLEAGEDPRFIARRLIIAASEDVGNAQPAALMMANAAFDAVERIGMPEAAIVLAQTVVYLAASPKSNTAYRALQKAQDFVRRQPPFPVPLHLRNAPTPLMKQWGYGQHYHYPHDAPHHFVRQSYWPVALSNSPPQFYEPHPQGREKQLMDYLRHCWPCKYDPEGNR